jgi:hypothetical protein
VNSGPFTKGAKAFPSLLPFAALLALAPAASLAAPPDLDALAARVRTLVEALVAADTENPPGNEARAVAVGAARLRAEGISFETFEFAPGRSNLIVRLKGDGSGKPLLLLAHIDVVPTASQPWTVPAHQVTVKGDRLYGRRGRPIRDGGDRGRDERDRIIERHRPARGGTRRPEVTALARERTARTRAGPPARTGP